MPIGQTTIEELSHSVGSLELVKARVPLEELIDTKPLFNYINLYASIPFGRVRLGAARLEKSNWLEQCLDGLDFRNRCYLFVAGTGTGWQWSEVEAANSEEWILDFLLRNDVDDFMVLSHDQQSFLGLVEDEADYLAFVIKDIKSHNF